MAFVFQRRLAVPLWAIAFFTVALTAAPPTATLFVMPPITVFAIAAVGIAAILFLMPGSLPWLRTSRAPVRVLPSRLRDQANVAITMTAGTGVRTLDEPNRSAANDALDLHRMDDDGGWQMSRPPA
jgi:hypothetical protein